MLPREAYLPINRCNLPAVILGSPPISPPMPLRLDGVAELHADLFRRLDAAQTSAQRRTSSGLYDRALSAESPEDAGYNGPPRRPAPPTGYRILRGWSINADSREGAILKGWVESRFGLTPRFSASRCDPSGAGLPPLSRDALPVYMAYALEAQPSGVQLLRRAGACLAGRCAFDAVSRRQSHDDFEQLGGDARRPRLLLNNLNCLLASANAPMNLATISDRCAPPH